jgi:hypothetical protein
MANPWEFLSKWVENHVHATAYDDDGTAKNLAAQCLEAAKKAGISAASVIKAAGGNLQSFMLDALNSAVNREVDRQASKDD